MSEILTILLDIKKKFPYHVGQKLDGAAKCFFSGECKVVLKGVRFFNRQSKKPPSKFCNL